MNSHALTRSAAIAVILAWLVTFLPGLRTIQAAEAAGAPRPLPRFTDAAILAAQTPPLPCGGRTRIVQDCTLGALPGVRALEQQVIADLIAIHKLPASATTPGTTPPPGSVTAGGVVPDQGPQDSASRLLSWERDSLRALLFDKIAAIITKPTAHTDEEKAIVAALAARVGQTRLASATEAKRYYNLWQNNPCAFNPPAGFSYSPPQSCFIPNALSGIFQFPPSLEQFQAYGAASATSEFQTNVDLQAAAAGAAKAYGLLGGVAIAGIAAAATYTVVVNAAFGAALVAAIFPYALKGTALSTAFAAGAASGQAASAIGLSAGAGGIAMAALIAVIAITIGVIAAITVFTADAIPAKLDAAITAAQAPPDLRALIATEDGKREIYGAFLSTTVNSSGSGQVTVDGLGLDGWAPVPAAQPGDQKFLLNPGPSAQTSTELVLKGWEQIRRARLSQGWFVDQTVATAPVLTLELDYLNHAGEQWTAWRIGDQFLHTTAGNVKPAFLSDLIQYQDAAGANRTAKMLAADRTPPSAKPTLSPPANAAGWHNAPVTVTWNWTDNPGGDGLDTAACPTSSAIAPGTTVVVTCKDLAGNEGTGTASAKIDTQAPAFSGPPTLSPAPNAAGWHNTDVTVTFACNDGDLPGVIVFDGTVSGVAACGPTRTLTSEGRNQSVTGTATDAAGNSTTRTFDGINIDKTAPAFAPPPGNQTVNATGPAGAAVTFSAAATDTLDPAPKVSCSHASGATFAVGATTVTCTATDHAGNTTTTSFTVTVKGAAAQLTDLKAAAARVGPGTSLSDKVQAAQVAFEAGNTATACAELQALLNQVAVLPARQLAAAQDQLLTADATRIRAVLACR